MNAQLDRTDEPRWHEAATIAALLTCYDVWSASPTFDCELSELPATALEPES